MATMANASKQKEQKRKRQESCKDDNEDESGKRKLIEPKGDKHYIMGPRRP